VIVCHYVGLQNPRTPIGFFATWGFCGVDLFFVLSGFLIGGILLDHVAADNYYRIFYGRRLLRIVPVFVLSILAVGALPGSILHFPLFSHLTFTQDIYLGLAKSSGLDSPQTPLVMGAVWSLAVEEKFYLLIAPAIHMFSRYLKWIILSVLLASPVIRVLETIQGGPAGADYARVFPFGRFDSLLLGVAIAYWMRVHPEKARRFASDALPHAALFTVMLAIVWLASLAYSETIYSFFGYSLLALICGCLLLHIVHFPERWKLLKSAPLARLGVLSYSIYLLHSPVLYAVKVLTDSYALQMILGCGLTYLIAETSWGLLESRLIRIGQSFRYESGSARRFRGPEAAAAN
jgi:peptidoglycan/LPS O-acetylase OafA/YrhL